MLFLLSRKTTNNAVIVVQLWSTAASNPTRALTEGPVCLLTRHKVDGVSHANARMVMLGTTVSSQSCHVEDTVKELVLLGNTWCLTLPWSSSKSSVILIQTHQRPGHWFSHINDTWMLKGCLMTCLWTRRILPGTSIALPSQEWGPFKMTPQNGESHASIKNTCNWVAQNMFVVKTKKWIS